MKKVALHNLGCKVNAYETEAMQQQLSENGYEIVDFNGEADVYIINTCTVTNMADRKSRQMLHRARKKNPDAVIVACGCYVQAQEDSDDGVIDESIDIVVGNNKKKDIVSILRDYEQQHAGRVEEVIDINHTQEYEPLHISQTAEHTRAYIKVQDGCNQFCSYCIIPFARGRVRSRKPEDVLDEVRTLSQNGYQEVVVTGIHLSSYGVDLEDGNNLLALIRMIHEVPGIKRIRLGSLEPRIITEEFAREISSLTKVCPHFHLSLQSGCDETLARMNRKYTTKEYEAGCDLLRRFYEHPALTTDVIVGFPGETEEEFQQSYQFVEKIGFYETHIFKYSKRKGTKAAEMKDQIPEQEKTRRSNQLIELGSSKQTQFEEWYDQKEVEVLIEETIERDGQEYQVGHTKEYVKVGVIEKQDLKNKLVHTIIGKHSQIIH